MGEDLDLPWVHTRDGIEDAGYSHLSSTQDGFGDVATVWSPNAKEKTAYIVLAANHHHKLVKALQALTNLGDNSIAEDIRKALRPHERASFDTAIRNGIVALAAIKEASNERP